MCVIHEDRLREAARMAVQSWLCPECALSQRMRAETSIDAEFLTKWLGYWRVPRGCPEDKRDVLICRLNHWRQVVQQAEACTLPGLVEQIAEDLHRHHTTRGQQISMVSKFAHSMRPGDITPFDSQARDALRGWFMHSAEPIRYGGGAQDYQSYARAFALFLPTITEAVNRMGDAEAINAQRMAAEMPDNLFRLRTADKYLWLCGKPV